MHKGSQIGDFFEFSIFFILRQRRQVFCDGIANIENPHPYEIIENFGQCCHTLRFIIARKPIESHLVHKAVHDFL
jgi:hypothetical protein